MFAVFFALSSHVIHVIPFPFCFDQSFLSELIKIPPHLFLRNMVSHDLIQICPLCLPIFLQERLNHRPHLIDVPVCSKQVGRHVASQLVVLFATSLMTSSLQNGMPKIYEPSLISTEPLRILIASQDACFAADCIDLRRVDIMVHLCTLF